MGENGCILTSSDGNNWTHESWTLPPNWNGNLGSPDLTGVTYGNNTFVVVGDSGMILTSSNGVDWTYQNAGTYNELNGVAYGNNTFVAVGGPGGVITSSPDGTSWTTHNSGISDSFSGVTYGQNTFVAVGENGTIVQSGALQPPLAVSSSPSSVPADGSSISTVTAVYEDVYGNPVYGATINFSTDLGTLSSASAVTDNTGSASVNIKSAVAGTASVTASVYGLTATTQVNFTPLVQTPTPIIDTPIYAGATSVSGTSADNASIYITGSSPANSSPVSIWGGGPPITATATGSWTATGLPTLNAGDTISVEAQVAGDAVSQAATATVVAAPNAPTIVSAVTSIDGKTINVTFSENMAAPPSAPAGFTVNVAGSADNVNAVALDNNNSEYDLTLAIPVQYGQTVTLAYTSGSGVQSADGGVLAAFSGLVVSSGGGGSSPTVTFTDPNLENAVRVALNIPNGDITEADMAGLTTLNAAGDGIVSLNGLEYAGNLQVLRLDNNQISDISSLSGLTSLQQLYISSNQISDISSLFGLTSLQQLELNNNQISDISSQSGLTNLQLLVLDNNQITNLTPLESLIHLNWLTLAVNQVTDLEPLVINNSNGGLGKGAYVDVRNNYLLIRTGTTAFSEIKEIVDNGTVVNDVPQLFSAPLDGYQFANSPDSFDYDNIYINGIPISLSIPNSYSIPLERYQEVYGPNVYVPNDILNQAWTGNCFGMTLTSCLFHIGYLDPNTYGTSIVYNIPAPINKYASITKLIEKYQISQPYSLQDYDDMLAAPSIGIYPSTSLKNTVADLLTSIEATMSGTPVPALLIIGGADASSPDGYAGHAIVPVDVRQWNGTADIHVTAYDYKGNPVQEVFPPGSYMIDVYNPNLPYPTDGWNQSYVLLDPINNKWLFELSPTVWWGSDLSGSNIELLNISPFEVSFDKDQYLTPIFEDDQDTFIYVNTSPEMQMSNSNGQNAIFENGLFNTQIQGALHIPTSDTSTDSQNPVLPSGELFSLPTTSYTVTSAVYAGSSGNPAEVDFMGRGLVLSANRTDPTSPVTGNLSNGSISLVSNTGQPVTLDLYSDQQPSRPMDVSVSGTSAAGSTLTGAIAQNQAGVVLTNSGTSGTFDVTLQVYGAQTGGFSVQGLQLPAGIPVQVALVNPQSPATSPISITLDSATTPVVISSAPQNGATAVPVSGPVTVTFSEPIQAGASISSVSLTTGNTSTPVTCSFSGDTLTITPTTGLAYGTTYTATIPAEAVENAADYSMIYEYTFSFTTVSPTYSGGGGVGSPVVYTPAIQTQAASSVTATSVALNGDITSDNGYEVTDYGFLWGTGSNSLTNKLDVGTNNQSGAFTDTLGSLTAGTTYYFQAYATNSQGTADGTVMSFTTTAVTPVPVPAQVFSDVPSSYWAYPAISSLRSKGIVSGYPDGTFKPGAAITRAEFATMLVKALGLSTTGMTGTFTDVAADDWYYGSVNDAVYDGLVSGMGDNLFAPNALITREQMAVMVAKALGTNAPAVDGTELSAFSDGSAVSSWAVTGMEEAVKAGIVNGMTADTLAPLDSATRAQAAVMIFKLLSILGK